MACVFAITENGEILDRGDTSPGLISHLAETYLSPEELSRSHCLQYIDPYGDTVFNMLQKAILLEEMCMLRRHLPEQERNSVTPAIELTAKFLTKVHTYIKFYGD
jgi:hypothetical protein